MSILAALPAAELIALAAGLGSSAIASLLTKRNKLRSREVVLETYLANEPNWRKFETDRLSEILKDRFIDDREWKEIIKALDQVALEIAHTDQDFEKKTRYLARSERSKKILVSEYLSKKHKEQAEAAIQT